MQRFVRGLIVGLPLLTLGVVACSPPAPATAPATSPPTSTTAPVAKPSPAPASPAAAASASPSPSPSALAAASPSAAPAAAPKPPDASLSITSPTNGQALPAGSVTVTVQYSGPQLVAAANATKLDDYHLHYILDENATPYIGTLVPVPTGNPRIVHTASLQTTFDNVAAGSHTVVVMLSGANHISTAPPLSAQVTFTVQ